MMKKFLTTLGFVFLGISLLAMSSSSPTDTTLDIRLATVFITSGLYFIAGAIERDD